MSRRGVRRWELTDDERQKLSHVHDRPLRARELGRLVLRNPGLGAELAECMVGGAVEAVRSGSSLIWAIDAARARTAVAQAAAGSTWAGGERFPAALMPLVLPGMSVLDLGCGAGRFARQVAPIAGQVTCVDPSRTLLAEARQQLSRFENVAFLRAHDLPPGELEDACVDLVYSQGLLGYLDPRSLLAMFTQVRRVLRPEGSFLFNVYTVGELGQPTRPERELQEQISQRRLHSGTPQPYTPEYMIALLARGGFEVPSPQALSSDREDGYTLVHAC